MVEIMARKAEQVTSRVQRCPTKGPETRLLSLRPPRRQDNGDHGGDIDQSW